MEGVHLTRAAITGMADGRCAGGGEGPVAQVLDLKLVQSAGSAAALYRLLLSDGSHAAYAMLSTEMNALVESRAIRVGSIVRLIDLTCHVILHRKVIIVLKLDVILEICNVIGEPRIYNVNSAVAFSPMPATLPPLCPSQPSNGSLQSNSASVTVDSGTNQFADMRISSRMEPTTSSISHNTVFSNPMENEEHKSCIDLSQSACPQEILNSEMAGEMQGKTSAYDHHNYEQAQPPAFSQNRGPTAKSAATTQLIAIAALNPYQDRWTIKARVTSKGELRCYSTPRGDGKVFSFALLDSEGGEIPVTSFNNVADQFYEHIDIGKVYLISKGIVKPAQKKFNHLNCKYEIVLESESLVQCCPEDDCIGKQQFNFRTIAQIEGIEDNMTVDVIGFLLSITPTALILTKNGKETLKRTLNLKDMSGRSVGITLWGNFCNEEGLQLKNMRDSGLFPVLAVKSGRVSDFGGKSISTISTTQLYVNPDFPEAQRLKDWLNTVGRNFFTISILSEMPLRGRTDTRRTVSQIQNGHLGSSVKPDLVTVKASISFVKSDNVCYAACPLLVGDRQCSKKVDKSGDGNWHCYRCLKSFPECDYRYLLKVQIQDHTGAIWVTAFEESGEEIMGVSAKELYSIKFDELNDVKFANMIRGVLCNQYVFMLKIKEEAFSDEPRFKSTVTRAEKVNSLLESRYLIGIIERFLVEDPVTTSEMPGVCHSEPTKDIAALGDGGSILGNYQAKAMLHQEGSFYNRYDGSCSHAISGREMQLGCGDHTCVNRAPFPAVDTQSALGTLSGNCYRCHQPGHWAKTCPESNAATSTYRGSSRYG